MSLSTTKAEYKAAATAAQENTWLMQMMKDLHQAIDYVIPLHYDVTWKDKACRGTLSLHKK